MRYFRLLADCFLVEGEQDAALYDATRGRIFLLDRGAQALLRACEDNQPIDDSPSTRAWLEALSREGLGAFHETPPYVDKMLPKAPVAWRGFAMQPPAIRKIDWSLTHRCDWNCEGCPRRGGERMWQPCTCCIRRPTGSAPRADATSETRLLEECVALGIGGLHIRGGNPLLPGVPLEPVLDAASRHPNLTIVVTTAGTGRPLDQVISLYDYPRLRLNIVVPDGRPDAPDASGRRDAQARVLDELLRRHLPFSLTVLLTGRTAADRDAIVGAAQARWGVTPQIAEVYSPDYVRKGFRFTHVGRQGKMLHRWRTIEELFFRLRANLCLYGGFEIGVDGTIVPCAGLDRTAGVADDAGLGRALSSGAFHALWNLTKDDISPCKRCALRFACADCSAAELADASDAAHRAYCPFDPSGPVAACDAVWEQAGFVRTLRIQPEWRSQPSCETQP